MNTFFFVSFLLSSSFSAISGHVEILPREFGGVEVQPNSFPFIVSLVHQSKERNLIFCTGSILNEHWILTAAHCLELYPEIHLVAGHHNLKATENTTQVRKAFTMYQHKSLEGDGSNCIGLIYVKDGFTITKEVQPVALGELSTVANEEVTVQGWGCSLLPKERIYPENLRSTNLFVVSVEQCKTAYPMKFNENINFCASKPDHVACLEQAGGPIIQNGVQVGIVPWRTGELETSFELSVFIKISVYNSWIQEQFLQKSSLDDLKSKSEANAVKEYESKAGEINIEF